MLAYLEVAMKLAPLLIQAGQDIAPFARDVYNTLVKGDEPSAEDWSKLTRREEELRAVLQEPLPPE